MFNTKTQWHLVMCLVKAEYIARLGQTYDIVCTHQGDWQALQQMRDDMNSESSLHRFFIVSDNGLAGMTQHD